MAHYSDPYRLFLVKDPATGARRQFTDAEEARRVAEEIAGRTGRPLAEVLVPSRYWYSREVGLEVQKGERRKLDIRHNTKTTTKHMALKWVSARNARAVGGVVEPQDKLFGEAVDLWLAEKKLARRAEKTVKDYEMLATVWKEKFRGRLVREITAEDIINYFTDREGGKLGKGKKLSASTLTKERVVLGQFFRWASREAPGRVPYCSGNPVATAPRWSIQLDEPEALTREEAKLLLHACSTEYVRVIEREGSRPYKTTQKFLPPPHLYGIVLTALHSLLRLNNILRLTWGDVDLENGIITIASKSMKTRRQQTVMLTPTLKAYLGSLPRSAPAAPVFGTELTTIRRAFRGAARRAGLRGLKFHTLRKTGATLLLDAGLPLKVVQEMGGWKTPGVLLKHYAAATEKARQKATAKLDWLIGG